MAREAALFGPHVERAVQVEETAVLRNQLRGTAAPRKDRRSMTEESSELEQSWSVPDVARHIRRTESLVRQLIRDGRLQAQANTSAGRGAGRGAQTRYQIARSEIVRYCLENGYAEPGVTPPPPVGSDTRRSTRASASSARHTPGDDWDGVSSEDTQGAHAGAHGFDAALMRELQQAEQAVLQERVVRLEAMLEARDTENARLRGIVRDLSAALSRSVEEPDRH